MKKFSVKPGFEFIFSLSLIVVLGLPPMLLAQTKKDMEIKIENGDTTINGKNIKELSATDKQEALMNIGHLDQLPDNRKKGDDARTQRIYSFKQMDSVDSKSNHFDFHNRKDFDPMFNRPGRLERRNTQDFNYVNIDNEGISTHVRFHVSEISNDDLKKLPYVEGGKFDLTDLNLLPEFTTGKTLLMFTLPAKTVAEVKLTDSEGKVLWTEKTTTASFSKTFELGLNGIYYLQVKQGRNVAVKKIMKEE